MDPCPDEHAVSVEEVDHTEAIQDACDTDDTCNNAPTGYLIAINGHVQRDVMPFYVGKWSSELDGSQQKRHGCVHSLC